MNSTTWLRLVVYVLIAAAILIGLVPLLVLLNLVEGGTGFGLCPDGIRSCRNPYTAAPELTTVLTLALFGIVAMIRILMRMVRRMTERPQPEVAASSSSVTETR